MFSDESNNRITEKRVLYYIQLSKEAREKATSCLLYTSEAADDW